MLKGAHAEGVQMMVFYDGWKKVLPLFLSLQSTVFLFGECTEHLTAHQDPWNAGGTIQEAGGGGEKK